MSSLVDNLSEGIHDNGKCTKCNSSLEYISISKKRRLLFECFDCKKRYTRKFDKKFKKSFRIPTIFVMETLISLCFY